MNLGRQSGGGGNRNRHSAVHTRHNIGCSRPWTEDAEGARPDHTPSIAILPRRHNSGCRRNSFGCLGAAGHVDTRVSWSVILHGAGGLNGRKWRRQGCAHQSVMCMRILMPTKICAFRRVSLSGIAVAGPPPRVLVRRMSPRV